MSRPVPVIDNRTSERGHILSHDKPSVLDSEIEYTVSFSHQDFGSKRMKIKGKHLSVKPFINFTK